MNKLIGRPISQSQEPCSGLRNVHASGLFCDSTNPSSTSQMCCGHRTQVLQKHMSQTNIQSALTHPCTDTFSWAQWVISPPWVNAGGQKAHLLPHVLNTDTGFQPCLDPQRLSGILVNSPPEQRCCPQHSLCGIKVLWSPLHPHIVSLFSTQPLDSRTRQPQNPAKSTVFSLKKLSKH